MTDYLSEVFGENGLLAARFPRYETRQGQITLAELVDSAMANGHHALGEAPCGTGKSLAYCVPAAHHAKRSGTKTVIVTANIALQEQLVTKDLPFLATLLPEAPTFALVKGRSNYLCVDQVLATNAAGGPKLRDAELQEQALTIKDWAWQSQSGDISELPFVPHPKAWAPFSVATGECAGDKCLHWSGCYFWNARQAANAADIVVTNYHVLFTHLVLLKETGRHILLPPFDALVLDEAHAAGDIARQCFGFEVTPYGLERLATRAQGLGDKQLPQQLRQESRKFFARAAQLTNVAEPQMVLRMPHHVDGLPLVHTLKNLASTAGKIANNEQLGPKVRANGAVVERLARLTAGRLTEATELTDEGKVYWVQQDRQGRIRVVGQPVDIHQTLAEELFEPTRSVTMVSATLTTSGNFGYIRRELGVPADARELAVDSPFDFESQALLVVPEDMLEPGDEDFAQMVAGIIEDVIDQCDGRTLGLFTSYRVLNAVHQQLPRGKHTILRQGDAPRTQLTQQFKEDVSSVLLGTESFWTGIDVPGEALTALVIDKLPLPTPSDPIAQAHIERDRDNFRNYFLPRAIITLRQGVGRLIRTKSDVGVVVLLDRRVADRRYGNQVLCSLPPMLASRQLESITRFLNEARSLVDCPLSVCPSTAPKFSPPPPTPIHRDHR
jgi:ATP-dependent DNA helicase DinG